MDEKEIKRELGENQDESENRQPPQAEVDFLTLARKRAEQWETKYGAPITRSKAENRFMILKEHWPEKLKADREKVGLPCLTIHHGIVHRDGVAGELLQDMPAGKFRGFDSDNDPKMAEIGTSLLRRIEANSNVEDIDAETVKMALLSGYPAWQVVYHDYADTNTFNQEIFIKFIQHQYSVYLDPNMTALDKPERGGPKWGMIIEDMPKAEFEREYPGAAAVSLEGLPTTQLNWWSTDTVRVASYYVAEPREIKLMLLEGNQVVEKGSDEHKQLEEAAAATGTPLKALKERATIVYDIMHYRISGREILPNDEGERKGQKVAGEYIPIIPWEGKYDYLESGEKYYRGVFSNAIDANKMLSYHATMAAERAATGRQHKGTPEHFKGFVDQWGSPIGHAVLMYNHDPKEPGGPKEINTVTELEQSVKMMQYAGQEIKDLTNRHEASLGEKSNETSGKAIMARQQQGSTSNFEFPLNFARAKRYRTKIIESMIPEVLDYEMAVRIIGDDGKEKGVEYINQPKPGGINEYLNDTSKARFDTVVDTGPSFKTQRMEAAYMLQSQSQASPVFAELFGDLLMRSMDFPYADEASKRLKFFLEGKYPGITEAGAGDEQAETQAEVKKALEQFKQQMLPQMQQLEQNMQEQVQALQAANQENAQLRQERDEATDLMKQKTTEFEQKDRKHQLDLREFRLEMQEKQAGGNGNGAIAALQKQVEQLTDIVDKLVPQEAGK